MRHFRYVVDFDQSKLNTVTSMTTETGRIYKHLDIVENGVLVEGNSYPSITTVMSWLKRDIIREWRIRVGEEEANKITKSATTRGTSLHDVCEQYLSNNPNYIDAHNYTLSLAFDTIKPILDNCVDNIFCLEKALYSNHLGVAGRVDCIAHYNNKPTIIDFKTSKKMKRKEHIDTYFMQATAYAIMFEELTNIPIPHIAIVMSVDGTEGIVFNEKRDNYVDQLIDSIKQYKLLNQ